MTIASEVTRIKTNIAQAYTALEEKGATIPEVKNSDNLSDAIGSIATGGGSSEIRGSWIVPQICLDLDNVIANIEQSEVYQNIKRFVSLKYGNNYTVGVVGIVLRNGYHNVKFDFTSTNTSAALAVEVSDGRCFYSNQYDSSNATNLSFTLDTTVDDKYYIVYWVSDPDRYSTGYAFGKIDDNYLQRSALYYSIKNVVPPSLIPNSNIESFNIIGEIKEENKLASTNGDFCFSDKMLAGKYYPPISLWCQTNGVASLTYNVYAVYFSQNAGFCALPDGLDLSSYNGTQDFQIGILDSSSYQKFIAIGHKWRLYITIPATNVKFCQIALTKDNWAYIAEHAPVVEGKTLTIGSNNLAICGGEDSEIIITLKNKGWTIA